MDTLNTSQNNWRFLFRVLLKAAALFVVVNLIFALLNPLPLIGKLSIYNWLVPGRDRLPYGEQPEAYNLSLDNLDAMFASHEVSQSKPDEEYRILIAGDSSVWGILLRPEETLSAQLNTPDLTIDGQKANAYNIGHPVLSVTKDLMLIDRSLQYEPDMIIWLVTLQSLPIEVQLTAPLVRNNAETVQSLISEYSLPLDVSPSTSPDFFQLTLVGQRRALADWWRLQLYGFTWTQTGIDQVYRDYTPRANDFEADITWQGRTEADGLDSDDLLIDALKAAHHQLDVPLLIVNEPIYIASGTNSDLRYNFWYPRWAYDRYRDLMQQAATENNWNYLDLWDSIAPEEFTDSPVHLTSRGSAQLAELIAEVLNEHRLLHKPIYKDKTIMDETTVREKLRDFIVKELIRDPKYKLTDTEGIISGGLIDSFSLAQIGVYAEDQFNVYIPDPDLTVAKMDTLDQMVARVMRDVK